MAFRAIPSRTCVGCRARAPKPELVRVVVAGTQCVPDLRGRLQGRGAYVHGDPACLDLAERRRAFLRAFRVPGPLDAGPVRAWVAQRSAEQRFVARRSAEQRSAEEGSAAEGEDDRDAADSPNVPVASAAGSPVREQVEKR